MVPGSINGTSIAARLPLLITGIAGVPGYNAFHYLRKRYPGQVVGVRLTRTSGLRGEDIHGIDGEDREALRTLFRQHRFRSVLHSTGSCALKSCELDPDMARLINVESVAVMTELVREYDFRLVLLSTDLVYSGTLGRPYVESDPVDPVTVYGKTMVEAEDLALSRLPSTAVLRISLPMGPSFNRHAGAIDWIDSRFRNGRPATLYYDEVRSATYVDDLSRVFEWFLANNAEGIFHLGGPRPVTLYQIGQIVNRVGGYPTELLKGCPRGDAGPMPPRAGDVTMNSDKLVRAMGVQPFQPWPISDELLPDDRDWHRNRSKDEEGSFQQIVRRLYGGVHHAGRSCANHHT
jgi:dTDP-4-dehydrorhamnose reductase